jgi:protein arginine kinase activator
MICDLCKQEPASVTMKQVVDGVVKEMQICTACAAKHGLQAPLSVTDFLFGVSATGDAHAPDAARRQSCPRCHMTAADFRKSSRLGCGVCYETFKTELEPMIASMHRARQHVGRRPVREARRAELVAIREQLAAAVQRQAFEEAAALRDRIHALEAQTPEGVHGR